MSNPLERRRNLLAEDEYTSKFDYEKFEIEQADKEILINYEQNLRQQQMIYIKTNINIGKVLFDAREKLKSYDSGTFMAWYEELGFNKDSVSRFLKRYELYLKFPQKQQYISDIPVRLVTELTKKNVDEELVEEAINKEVMNTKEYRELKSNYSHSANSQKEKVEEAQIVEKVEDFYNENEVVYRHKYTKKNIVSDMKRIEEFLKSSKVDKLDEAGRKISEALALLEKEYEEKLK